jgi:hypothetical protein
MSLTSQPCLGNGLSNAPAQQHSSTAAHQHISTPHRFKQFEQAPWTVGRSVTMTAAQLALLPDHAAT